MLPKKIHALLAIVCQEHGVSIMLQSLSGKITDDLLVVDDQNCALSTTGGCGFGLFQTRGRRFADRWKEHAENGALTNCAGHLQLALVSFHDPEHGGQSQAA